MMWLLVFSTLLHCASTYDIDLNKLEGLAKAKVELNRLREVKAFVTQDIPLYHNLVMKHIPGADPELVLLDHAYQELDRIALSDMSRLEINELLDKLGFYKKTQEEDEVPIKFLLSPAKDSPFQASPDDPSEEASPNDPSEEASPDDPSEEASPDDPSEEASEPQPQAERSDL